MHDGRYILVWSLTRGGECIAAMTNTVTVAKGAAVSDVARSGPVRVDAMAPCGVSEVNGSVGIAYDSTWTSIVGAERVRVSVTRNGDAESRVVLAENGIPCAGTAEYDFRGWMDGAFRFDIEWLDASENVLDAMTSRLTYECERLAPPAVADAISVTGMAGTRPLFAHDRESLAYSTLWQEMEEPQNTRVQVLQLREGGEDLLLAEESGSCAGHVEWNTAGLQPGAYDFCLRVLDQADSTLESHLARFVLLGAESIVMEDGRLPSDAVWTSNNVYIVAGTVTVPADVTLTIQPGTVVKFLSGTGLAVESNGTCVVHGVIFTHINDDTAGGDTLFDGAATSPAWDDYAVSGTVADDDATEYRYSAPVAISGTISTNTCWRGHKVYQVSGNLTVASGATLTIQPGAVVKFAAGGSLTVSSNGTLDAIGTCSAPIVFTSIKDDEHGGDTNGDGATTSPAAGDWKRMVAGGTMDMDFCRIYYTNPDSNQGSIQGSGGAVTFHNGRIEHAGYAFVCMNNGTFTANNSVFRDSSVAFGVDGGSGTRFHNCVIADVSVACLASNKSFFNTVFYNCLEFADQGGEGSGYKNCLFFNPEGHGAQSHAQVGTNGNIWGDPLFVDAANGNYQLQMGSPCVDAGDDANAGGEWDAEGNARIQGNAVDIGAYESAFFTTPSASGMPPVPFTWIAANFSGYVTNGDYDAAATNPLPSGYTIEAAYLIGLTNGTDKLEITSIDLSTDPPTLTFAPSNALTAVKYTQKGVTNLTGEAWTSPLTPGHRFFHLEVKWEE